MKRRMRSAVALLENARCSAWHLKRSIRRGVEDTHVLLANRVAASSQKKQVVILDNTFPDLLWSYKIAEFNAYLERFESAEVHSTAIPFFWLRDPKVFSETLSHYARQFPQHANRVHRFNSKRDLHATIGYTFFLHNAYDFLHLFERQHLPFVFTLCPGGGFRLFQKASDEKLRHVCSSPNFRKVIVNQRVTRDYLSDQKLCDPSKVAYLYGGVLPADRFTALRVPKKFYGLHKRTFDICFVAKKYTERGSDKGYDVFIEVARSLSRMYRDVFFHVVGGFDESDMDVSCIRDRIQFHKPQHTDFFPPFYSRMDIILSPNAPFQLAPGAFDGFPLSCCIEAGFCGVAIFCTDILKENAVFKDREELVIIDRDIDSICGLISEYRTDYQELCSLARRGQQALLSVFGQKTQVEARVQVLAGEIEVTQG